MAILRLKGAVSLPLRHLGNGEGDSFEQIALKRLLDGGGYF